MKEKYILERASARMLKIGLFIVTAAYFFAALYIYRHIDEAVMTLSYAWSIIEHVTMTLLIVVAASLLFDIHIKYNKG